MVWPEKLSIHWCLFTFLISPLPLPPLPGPGRPSDRTKSWWPRSDLRCGDVMRCGQHEICLPSSHLPLVSPQSGQPDIKRHGSNIKQDKTSWRDIVLKLFLLNSGPVLPSVTLSFCRTKFWQNFDKLLTRKFAGINWGDPGTVLSCPVGWLLFLVQIIMILNRRNVCCQQDPGASKTSQWSHYYWPGRSLTLSPLTNSTHIRIIKPGLDQVKNSIRSW